jgi:hypothetical protein
MPSRPVPCQSSHTPSLPSPPAPNRPASSFARSPRPFVSVSARLMRLCRYPSLPAVPLPPPTGPRRSAPRVASRAGAGAEGEDRDQPSPRPVFTMVGAPDVRCCLLRPGTSSRPCPLAPFTAACSCACQGILYNPPPPRVAAEAARGGGGLLKALGLGGGAGPPPDLDNDVKARAMYCFVLDRHHNVLCCCAVASAAADDARERAAARSADCCLGSSWRVPYCTYRTVSDHSVPYRISQVSVLSFPQLTRVIMTGDASQAAEAVAMALSGPPATFADLLADAGRVTDSASMLHRASQSFVLRNKPFSHPARHAGQRV